MKYNRNSTERVHLRFGAGDASQIVFLWAQSPTGKAVRTLTWKKDGTGDAAITKVDDRNFDIAWTAEETKLLSPDASYCVDIRMTVNGRQPSTTIGRGYMLPSIAED